MSNDTTTPSGGRPGLATGIALALGVGAVAAFAASRTALHQRYLRHPADDAPLRDRREDSAEGLVFVGRSILINRPRHELYAYWRDLQNLPRFMENVEAIRMTGERSAVWTIKAPAGQTVEVETEITEEVADSVIAWRSVPGSQIETQGRVTFREAPGGRGTVVDADIGYRPPGGDLGRAVAKLFFREPNVQARQELKRFKMLMETGEIATAKNRREPANQGS